MGNCGSLPVQSEETIRELKKRFEKITGYISSLPCPHQIAEKSSRVTSTPFMDDSDEEERRHVASYTNRAFRMQKGLERIEKIVSG